ncbi:hypothetical protein diail_8682 [Diaporthe ilicicola]|nr:hypothetical protein diail_8682 [Diaporthe ilicicola]
MACLLCRVEARLRRMRGLTKNKARSQTDSRAPAKSFWPRAAAPSPKARSPPPSTENLHSLRARYPTRASDLEPLVVPPQATLLKTCEVVADNAADDTIGATLEYRPELVAAQAIRAIAKAVSASPSHAAFVAAVTMAESTAFILADERDKNNLGTEDGAKNFFRRRDLARDAALDAAENAIAASNVCTWPSNIHGTNSLDSETDSTEPLPKYSYEMPSP